MEQTLLTDQDNALVHGGDASAAPYFAALADRAVRDLEAAGFSPCPAGTTAQTWHLPLPAWQERFTDWIERPRPDALLAAGIFFDFRAVHGALDLSPLEAVLARAARSRLFIRCLAKSALEFQPPPSLFVRLRGENIDLKRHGIAPIVQLARAYALEAASPARNTLDRLDAAVSAGLMGPDTHATIREAYRFLLGVRLRRQLHALANDRPPDNTVPLRALPSIERSRLKDSFRAIRIWQEAATYRYQTDLF
jgi:CBS domain-containing protein